MTLFLIGLAIFFGPHFYTSFRDRSPEKDIKHRMGYGPYMGLYSLISLIGLVLMVMGYGAMRPAAILYTTPEWTHHINHLLSAIGLVAIVASNMPPGHIKKTLKHPMLVGIKLWALGHLISNGELNSVLLFGAFLAYAVIDRIAVKRRGDLGAANATPDAKWDALAIFIGLAITMAFIMGLHGRLIGVKIV